MKIGQLARAAEVSVETIRYYQRIGLFPEPGLPETGYRRYDSEHLNRLVAIRRAKKLGFSLEEIRQIQNSRGSSQHCRAVCNLAEQTLLRVQTEIAELRSLEGKLQELLRQKTSSGECAVLRALDAYQMTSTS